MLFDDYPVKIFYSTIEFYSGRTEDFSKLLVKAASELREFEKSLTTSTSAPFVVEDAVVDIRTGTLTMYLKMLNTPDDSGMATLDLKQLNEILNNNFDNCPYLPVSREELDSKF